MKVEERNREDFLSGILHTILPQPAHHDVRNLNILRELIYGNRAESSHDDRLGVPGLTDGVLNAGKNLPDGIKLPKPKDIQGKELQSYLAVQEQLQKAIENDEFNPLPILEFLANPKNFRAAAST